MVAVMEGVSDRYRGGGGNGGGHVGWRRRVTVVTVAVKWWRIKYFQVAYIS